MKLLEIRVGFYVTAQILKTFSAFVRYSHRIRVSMILVRLIKMLLNEIYSKVYIDKHLSDSFPIQNGLKQGDALLHCFSTLLQNMPLGRYRKTRWN
jgi:hypothetical protein